MSTSQGSVSKTALLNTQAFFKPGSLGDKRLEAERLLQSGDTTLFEGAVRWRILLTEEDKLMKGRSESVDAAFSDILSCLKFLSEEHDDAVEVLCSVELDEGERG